LRRLFEAMNETVRIALWSGPRNISTALMRSFGSRSDTVVCDEPLYAHSLQATSLDHPGRDEILKRHETDWRKVVAWLTGPLPEGKSVFYQKHMAHHLLPDVDRAWLTGFRHAMLIREPREMLTSLIQVIPDPRLEDTGLPQQVELFSTEGQRAGRAPAVVDSKDLLDAPERILGKLCERLGIAFDPCMLTWQPGLRETDGCWAPIWYASVEKSTGFSPHVPKDDVVPQRLRDLHGRCCELYDRLHEHRIR